MINSGLPLICRMVRTMMPAVRQELEGWRRVAQRIPDAELRTQALASLEKKSFHCLGGGVYALYPGVDFSATLHFIIAFQTISDYLDNLCDRAGIQDEIAFRQLHLSMLDAVDPGAELQDYYSRCPHSDDGGYLGALVQACKEYVRSLPAHRAVSEPIGRLVLWYCELQSLKHMEPCVREERLKCWAEPLAAAYPGVSVWEFCAAAGSTLGIFLLFCAASGPAFTAAEAGELLRAYFPWVCGLHILLDYFIDAEEDEREGDFNFTSRYGNTVECAQRLGYFAGRSLSACESLKHSGFHKTVVYGLLAMYLSDPKAETEGNLRIGKDILKRGGGRAALYHRVCKALRKRGKL